MTDIPQFIRDADLETEFALPFVLACRQLAKEKHAKQTRIGGRPYFTHVEGVAEILVSELGILNTQAIAAAYLHDVIEDGHMTREELKQALIKFAQDDEYHADLTLLIVEDLTLELPRNWTDSMKEAIILGQLVRAGGAAYTYQVKLADRLHNLRSMSRTKWSLDKQLAYTLTGLRIYNLMTHMCRDTYTFTDEFHKVRMEMESLYCDLLAKNRRAKENSAK